MYSGTQTLMSGSNPMLGGNTGAAPPAGINLSNILPSGNLVPNALPAAMQHTSQPGQYKNPTCCNWMMMMMPIESAN